ncbi:MAG TPA: NADH-quinone oxidoreductase subunit N [Candidatus Angelobacter sp.]|nr:NADH-quinone oxidoreductase subunit N [Candidatus Angelobacter sp.]
MNPIQTVDYIRILPELVLGAFGIIVMMADAMLKPGQSRKSLGVISLFGTIAAIGATLYQITWLNRPGSDFSQPGWFGMVRVDNFAIFFHLLIPAISAICILASLEYLDAQNIRSGEYYALILFGTVGMVLMSSAIELVLIFIALEISSISTYVLAGYRRRNASSSESSIKYFLLGSFATAFFLYGVALMFGATGSTSIPDIRAALAAGNFSPLAIAATALMIVGLGFKVASAPFHIWTPDVYEGAPAPIVALMSTGPKAAAFAVLLRVLFATTQTEWFWLIWVSAALSMTLGNFGALVQNNVKRMLAYSSIAHAGYLLVAFAAGGDTGKSAAIFYTAAYAAMNVGAFAVVSHFAAGGERYVSLDDYAGLGRRAPLLAFTLTIFLLSLIGIPGTAGFFAKYYVFQAAFTGHSGALIALGIIGLINSAVASYYYLRLIVLMYMREPVIAETPASATAAMRLALVLAAIATIYLGVVPNRVLNSSQAGAQDLDFTNQGKIVYHIGQPAAPATPER